MRFETLADRVSAIVEGHYPDADWGLAPDCAMIWTRGSYSASLFTDRGEPPSCGVLLIASGVRQPRMIVLDRDGGRVNQDAVVMMVDDYGNL